MENYPPLTRQPQHKNDDIYGGIEAGTSQYANVFHTNR
jgi:hypothetical protein